MERLFFECGDKVTSEVNVIKDEISDTENIRTFLQIEECGNNPEDDAFFRKKICEACARKTYNIDVINTNIEGAYPDKVSRVDAKEVFDVTCRMSEYKSIGDSTELDYNNGSNQKTCHLKTTKSTLADLSYPTSFFTTNVDSKISSDNDLKEYEKQLQSYQRTLNVAQNVKKNAIRKQMLAKAFKLKLLEVENQCNIELLRIKQNLQCLEPLKMIAESWKTEENNIDFSKYELTPLFPDILLNTSANITSPKETPTETDINQ